MLNSTQVKVLVEVEVELGKMLKYTDQASRHIRSDVKISNVGQQIRLVSSKD